MILLRKLLLRIPVTLFVAVCSHSNDRKLLLYLEDRLIISRQFHTRQLQNIASKIIGTEIFCLCLGIIVCPDHIWSLILLLLLRQTRRKFLAEHEADLELYRAAQAEMRSLLGGAKLPKMDVLKEEGRKLTAKKKQLYGEYQKARRDMQELVTIKANIDTLMGYTEPGRKQEKER